MNTSIQIQNLVNMTWPSDNSQFYKLTRIKSLSNWPLWRIQCRNVTSDDPALNWDTAQHVTGNSRGPVAAGSHSPKWKWTWCVAERLCSGIVMHRRPPRLLLHLHHIFYCSLSWENRGNNIIFAGSCVCHWKHCCYGLLKNVIGSE